ILELLDQPFLRERQGTRFSSVELWLSSALVLVLTMLFAYSNISMFSLALSVPAILFVSVLILLISYVPIQVFGGLGIFEVSTVYLYGLFGIDSSIAIPFVITARIYLYLLNGLLLIYPLLFQS